MKFYIALINGLFFLTLTGSAQVIDTSDYMPPPPTESGVSSVLRSQRHLLFIDITHNSWFNLPEGIHTNFISGGINFSLYYDIFIAKKHFSIAPGIGYANSTVKNNAYSQVIDGGSTLSYTSLITYPDSVKFLKNKFSASYLDLPVEFRFRIKPDERGKNFWIAPGFRAGLLLSDFWKYKNEMVPGQVMKTKNYNLENIENFHYGISFRAGYYKFGVYAYYSLSTVFEKNHGPDLVPFSIGIAFTPL
ncbi:MAG: outer membrane beta-barrel protein [Chitinophagales bacterium]